MANNLELRETVGGLSAGTPEASGLKKSGNYAKID